MFKKLVRSLTNSGDSTPNAAGVTKDTLFDPIPPDCDLECHTCTIKYPANFKIEQDDDLWQTGKEWATHIVIATGKSDWVRDVEDEKGSIMEAISKAKTPTNGKLKVSASNMCPPPEYYTESPRPTTCIILPGFTQVEQVTPNDVPELIEKFINPGPTTTTPMNVLGSTIEEQIELAEGVEKELKGAVLALEHGDEAEGTPTVDASGIMPSDPIATPTSTEESKGKEVSQPVLTQLENMSLDNKPSQPAPQIAEPSHLKSYECPHDYLILLCSHKYRDARCGQSAPLLLKELRRHLQPLGLYRDLDDYRPGGVGIYFINHVGGHKWSANMMVYRKKAGQGIWLARVKPNDIEAIVKWTVLEGKVQPDKIRAGFDRAKGVTSW